MRRERKHYTAEEKVAILRRHLLDTKGVNWLPPKPDPDRATESGRRKQDTRV